jgi:hypothetical protein
MEGVADRLFLQARAAQVLMNRVMDRIRKWFVLGTLGFGALAGCAGGLTKDSPGDAKTAAATERSQARWALIIDKDLTGAYEYLSKASKQVISRQDFADRLSRTTFRSAKVEKIDCVGEVCKVAVRYTYDHPQAKGISNLLQETWILEDGRYVYVWPS